MRIGSMLVKRLPLRRIAIFVTSAALFYAVYVFVFPQILRFRFRKGLSWYDLGLHGFGPTQRYVSFDYTSPVVEISKDRSGCDPGLTFLAPRGDSIAHPGPMILDAQGHLVWMKHNLNVTQDFKVQRYKGQDYLTYWEGEEVDGRGYGAWYMGSKQLDHSYKQQFEVKPAGGFDGDLHEFIITSDDTALLSIYHTIPANLTPIGGPESGWLFDSVFQEIDIETGNLIFEWHASHHYPIESTFEKLKGQGGSKDHAFDFFHINSIDTDPQRNYLVSARHTHTISNIDRSTGAVLWTLGGKLNDFTDLSDGAATDFSWQHDARLHKNDTLTVLDNAASSNANLTAQSRAMVIGLDIPRRQARLLAAYYHPQEMKAVSQGNVQILEPTGNIFVGWGHSAAFTEFQPDGTLLCDVHFGASAYFTFGRVVSYRAFKGSWIGRPLDGPSAKINHDGIFISWNGATEVQFWRLEVEEGQDLEHMAFQSLGQWEKIGFETKIPIPEDTISPYFRLAALDSQHKVLGYTEILEKAPPSFINIDILGISGWGFVVLSILGLVFLSRRILRRRSTGWHNDSKAY